MADLNTALARLILGTGKTLSKVPTPIGVGSAMSQTPEVQQFARDASQVTPMATGASTLDESLKMIGRQTLQNTLLKGLKSIGLPEGDSASLVQSLGSKVFGMPEAQAATQSTELIPEGGPVGPVPKIQNVPQVSQPIGQPQPQVTPNDQSGLRAALGGAAKGTGNFLSQMIPMTLGSFGIVTPGLVNMIKENRISTEVETERRKGELPLSKAEKEKLEITGMNDFFKNIFTAGSNPQSAESAKLLGNVNSGIDQISQLQAQLDKNPNYFKNMNVPGNPIGQTIANMTEDLSDILGRLRSGGAINADEEKRFRKQIPSKGLSANFENPKVAKFKLQKLLSLFEEIKKTAEPRNQETASRIQQLIKAGVSQEQIYRVLKGS